MTKYTIGIYFDATLDKVALILKNRPKWQEGKYNFPGGHVEEDENSFDCIIREFEEECSIYTNWFDWNYIGKLTNYEEYRCDIFVGVHRKEHGQLKANEDQHVNWFPIYALPNNIISNLSWLVPFALNTIKQGNIDHLICGNFIYS